jgi:hypothetical protein
MGAIADDRPRSQRPPHTPTGASLIVLICLGVTAGGILVLQLVRRDLNPLHDVMSHYANGPDGPLMSVVFYAFGVSAIAMGIRLRSGIDRRGVTRPVPWLLVLAGPAAVGLAGLLLVLGFRHRLPDPVAVHWGADGAYGFASPDRALLLVWTGPVAGAAFGALALAVYRADGALRRHAAGLAVGLATFVTAVLVGSLWQQRGLADATAARDPDLVLVVALLLALALGAGAATLAPADRPGAAVATGPVPRDAPRVPLGPDERVAWSAWATASPAVLTVLAIALVPLATLAAAGIAPLFLLLVLLLVLALVTATMSARVWVDQRGLTVRSPLG